jgi:epoxyqueuosine reductase
MDVDRLREIAADAGCAGFGICEATPFGDTAVEMHRRRRHGSHAGLRFTYTDPDVATDVTASFPWARRLVVLAWSYLPDAGSPGPSGAGTGRIARFATADHYDGLRRAADAVQAALHADGWRTEILVDDNRLVDRAAAVRAGVGWWGKNAMVLAPGHGPWLLLGSVVTDAELPVSAPMTRDCGSCSACLPACPTGALVAPGVLDARRCLARWAQAPGIIPRRYRTAMEDRLYGCDDCIEACPPGGRAMADATRRRGRVDLVALLGASDAEILGTYGHFYLPGRRASILRRNALVAIGNVGARDALGVLAGYLGHPDPMLRIHAAWSLGTLTPHGHGEVLRASRERESHEDVLEEIAVALEG